MRASIETTTRVLPYSIATAWRYRCTFCGKHQGSRMDSAIHMAACKRNPAALPKDQAWAWDQEAGVHLPTARCLALAANEMKPLRALVARYVCKFCGARLADIGGITKHFAKCKASPALRGCRSCVYLEHELDGGCDCGHSACDIPDVHRVPVCAAKEEWLDDLVTGCVLWKIRTTKHTEV